MRWVLIGLAVWLVVSVPFALLVGAMFNVGRHGPGRHG